MMALHSLSLAQKEIVSVDNAILTHKHKYDSEAELSKIFRLDDDREDSIDIEEE